MKPIPDTPETQETRQEPCRKCEGRGYVILEGGYPLDCYVCKPREPQKDETRAQAARILRSWAGDRQRSTGKWTMEEQAAIDCAIRLESEPSEPHAALIAEIAEELRHCWQVHPQGRDCSKCRVLRRCLLALKGA